MDELVKESVASRKFIMLLLAAFASVALVLALAASTVCCRMRCRGAFELRLALGAKQGQVLGLIVSQGMRPVLLGLLIGTGLAIGVTRLMSSMLFGVGTTDPVTCGSGGAAPARRDRGLLASGVAGDAGGRGDRASKGVSKALWPLLPAVPAPDPIR